ncbi:hypothetical protein CR513_60000, partial [Mucuna pruriens]
MKRKKIQYILLPPIWILIPKLTKLSFQDILNTSKAYKEFNSRTLVVEESVHVKFNDGLTSNKRLLELEEDFAYIQIGLSDKPINAPKPSYARAIQ